MVREALPGVAYDLVWKRLYIPVLSSDERQLLFLLIHDKLPVKERLFRIGLKPDPYCLICPAALEGNREHFFSGCIMTKDAWKWLRTTMLPLFNSGLLVSNLDLLTLFLPPRSDDHGIIWLLGKYVHYVWMMVYENEREVQVDKLFGFLKYKYKSEEVQISSKLDTVFT